MLEYFKYRFFSFFLFFLFWLLLLTQWNSNLDLTFWGQLASLLLIISSCYMIFRSLLMKNIIALIIFCFISLYAIVPKYYFFDYIRISFHQSGFSDITMFRVTMIFAFFMILITLFTTIPHRSKITKLTCRDSVGIYWINLIIIALITLFGKSGENIFSSGSYHETLLNKETSFLNEYILIFILLAYIFSGGKRIRINFLYIITGIYCLKNLLLGGRIETVMIAILFLIIDIQYKVSFKKILFLFIIGIWIMNIYSTVRHNPIMLFSGELKDIFLPFNNNINREVISSNEGDVFYASERLFLLIETGDLELGRRIKSFMYFMSSIIVPFSFLPPEANLATYKVDVFSSGGGGLAPIFLFIFLSFPGVIFLSYLFSKSFAIISKDNLSSRYFYYVLLLATLPRWFAYYPVQIIKLCVYGMFFYLFFISISYRHQNRLRSV